FRQFWKVHLEPGAAIRMTGQVKRPGTYGTGGAGMFVSVRDVSNGQMYLTPQIGVPEGTTWTPFTTGTFTNTSGQAKDYWVTAQAVSRTIDVEMQIQDPTASRQLKLFLDVEGDFDEGNPASDENNYVPGARLSDGLSVALPQVIKVVAV